MYPPCWEGQLSSCRVHMERSIGTSTETFNQEPTSAARLIKGESLQFPAALGSKPLQPTLRRTGEVVPRKCLTNWRLVSKINVNPNALGKFSCMAIVNGTTLLLKISFLLRKCLFILFLRLQIYSTFPFKKNRTMSLILCFLSSHTPRNLFWDFIQRPAFVEEIITPAALPGSWWRPRLLGLGCMALSFSWVLVLAPPFFLAVPTSPQCIFSASSRALLKAQLQFLRRRSLQMDVLGSLPFYVFLVKLLIVSQQQM